MTTSGEKDSDFLLAEYRESANAYFKGVDIGWTGFRAYLTFNVLFAGLLGALAEPKGQLSAAGEMIKFIPFFALVASAAVATVTPHYFRHLENCRRRCQEIEKIKGGLLFTELGRIAHRGLRIRSTAVLFMVMGSIITFWAYFAFKNFPDFSITAYARSIHKGVCTAVSLHYWPCLK
jgi:hypothetical protein